MSSGETVALDELDHVAIAVDDIDEAIAWYTTRFGCNVLYRDPTWGLLEFANIRLALVVAQQHPPHIAFARNDAADFGELKTHRDGTASVYIADCSGNPVEIVTTDNDNH